MELFEGISINPGDLSIAALAILMLIQMIRSQRDETMGDQKIMLKLVENQTASTNRLADALEKNTESNNRVVLDAEKSRERTRQEQRDYQIALTNTLDGIGTKFDAGQTDIKSRFDMVIERVEAPLTAVLNNSQHNTAALDSIHTLVDRASQDIQLIKEALARIENPQRQALIEQVHKLQAQLSLTESVDKSAAVEGSEGKDTPAAAENEAGKE